MSKVLAICVQARRGIGCNCLSKLYESMLQGMKMVIEVQEVMQNTKEVKDVERINLYRSSHNKSCFFQSDPFFSSFYFA